MQSVQRCIGYEQQQWHIYDMICCGVDFEVVSVCVCVCVCVCVFVYLCVYMACQIWWSVRVRNFFSWSLP
jgi:hypothetical protein